MTVFMLAHALLMINDGVWGGWEGCWQHPICCQVEHKVEYQVFFFFFPTGMCDFFLFWKEKATIQRSIFYVQSKCDDDMPTAENTHSLKKKNPSILSTHVPTSMHMCMGPHAHAYTHISIYAHVQAHIHTEAHIHTRTLSPSHTHQNFVKPPVYQTTDWQVNISTFSKQDKHPSNKQMFNCTSVKQVNIWPVKETKHSTSSEQITTIDEPSKWSSLMN